MSRRLGQHFLIRGSVIQRIVRALDLRPGDSVLEIGPGKGALTRPLVAHPGPLLLVEKDFVLAEELRQRYSQEPHIQVRTGDFLDLPWSEIVSVLGSTFKVVSNLPYEAATAILVKLLSYAPPETSLVLMFQKEVGARLLAQPRTKDYGSLTVFCQVHAEVKSLIEVPPEAFRPPPKVRSQVLHLRIRKRPLVSTEDEPDFERLVQAGFAHRRKMLRQNLRAYFVSDAALEIEARLQKVQAAPTARAEELSVEQWLSLFKAPVSR